MNISVVVTCYNEERNIRGCLESLVGQEYPQGSYEVVVSDGGSHDGTQAVINEFARTRPNVRLVVEPKKGTAAGRNAAIRAARHDHIAFTDADCQAPPGWLALLAENYEDARSRRPNIAGVGGRNIVPRGSAPFTKAIEVALDSYMGSFTSAQGRQFKDRRPVSSLSTANALYDKTKISDIGCFDESLMSEAEDADMNYRMASKGSVFMFVPDSFVWHRMRPTPKGWFENMFRYGKGRARLLKRYPDMWNVSYVLPLLFAACMASGVFALLYLPGIFLFSCFMCVKRRSPGLAFHVMLVYILQHIGYAAGEVYGLVNPKVK